MCDLGPQHVAPGLRSPDGGSPGMHIISSWGALSLLPYVPFHLTARARSVLGILSHVPRTSGTCRVQGYVSYTWRSREDNWLVWGLLDGRARCRPVSLAQSSLGLCLLSDVLRLHLNHPTLCGSHLSSPFAKHHQAL